MLAQPWQEGTGFLDGFRRRGFVPGPAHADEILGVRDPQYIPGTHMTRNHGIAVDTSPESVVLYMNGETRRMVSGERFHFQFVGFQVTLEPRRV